MKTTKPRTLMTAVTAAAFALSIGPLLADDYEWDPTWGLHEEEWYDPSDWLNDDNTVDVEDTGAFGYDDNYYADDYWNDISYYTDYSYDDDTFDTAVSAVYYQWMPVDYTWETVESSQTDQKRASASQATNNPNYSGESKDISKDNVVTMKGEIVGMTAITPSGTNKEHHFLILEPADGKNVIVDCGPVSDAKKMKFEKGDKIQVRGTRAKAGGRYVLIAQQLNEANSQ